MQRPKTLFLALTCLGGLVLPASAGVTVVNPKAKKGSGITRSSGAPAVGLKKAKHRPAGHVLLSVKNADLTKTVLPLFEKQVGVKIKWVGTPRKVSLRLVQPMPWQDALELVAQFTNTHVSTDHAGRVILKGKWSGFVDEKRAWDDLSGQVEAPERLKSSALLASALRPGETRHPVTQPRAIIPKIRVTTVSRGVYQSRPNVARVPRRPVPYKAQQPYRSLQPYRSNRPNVAAVQRARQPYRSNTPYRSNRPNRSLRPYRSNARPRPNRASRPNRSLRPYRSDAPTRSRPYRSERR
jgi:hypothetical protein